MPRTRFFFNELRLLCLTKLAQEFVDCIRGVVPAILDIAVRTAVDSSGTASPPMASLVGAIKGQFEKDSTWGYTLLSALIQGSEDE